MSVPPPIELGNLGMADSLILMVLALVVFGPRRLPQIGRQIGKLMYEFRKASNDFKFQMEEELRLAEDADRRKKEEEERGRNLALNPPVQTLEAHTGAVATAEPAGASPYPGEGAYPEQYPPETAPPLPRIQPPSTGEPVAASRPGESNQPEPGAEPVAKDEGGQAAEGGVAAGGGADPATAAVEAAAATQDQVISPGTEPNPTEPVSQHG